MIRTIFTYGLAAGLIAGLSLTIVVVGFGSSAPHGALGMLLGYAIMLVALSTIFVAVKRRRDVDGGGVIRFLPALGLGVAISAVAGVLYVVAWDSALALSGMDFAGSYAKAAIAAEQAKGVSGAALARFTAEMDAFRRDYANPLYRWPMTFAEIFPVGVLVSVISAGLLCNRRFLPVQRAR